MSSIYRSCCYSARNKPRRRQLLHAPTNYVLIEPDCKFHGRQINSGITHIWTRYWLKYLALQINQEYVMFNADLD